MAAKTSAGILLFRRTPVGVEVLLGHMGGPLWARKDEGAWSIPKGEYDAAEEAPLQAALREYAEEIGSPAPDGERIDLGQVKQTNGKLVRVFGTEGQLDPDSVVPGTFTMEWPPRSGQRQQFPELDRVAWFSFDDAPAKLVRSQREFIDRLAAELRTRSQ